MTSAPGADTRLRPLLDNNTHWVQAYIRNADNFTMKTTKDIINRGPVQLPLDSEIVTDADEEVAAFTV